MKAYITSAGHSREGGVPGRRWLQSSDKFLFHVKPLAKEMKKRYLTLVEANADNLNLPEGHAARLQEAWQKKWIVYAKKPFAGPKQD